MKIKYQLAALAAATLLAGCKNDDQMGGQAQANVSAATNQAKDSASTEPPAAPAVAPPKAPDPAPPPAATPATPLVAASDTLATNVPPAAALTNSDASTNK